MSMRKFFTSVSLLFFISSPALSMDFRVDHVDARPEFYQVGWDQKSLEAQTQGAVYLRAKIEKLEQENEQLRNSFSQMRKKPDNSQLREYDARLNALIEENQILSSKLSNSEARSNNYRGSSSADAFAKKIYDLKAENSRIKQELDKAVTNNRSGNLFLEQENKRLKSSLAALYAADTDDKSAVLSLQKEIKSLKAENQSLKSKSGKSSKENIGKVVSLQKMVKELQDENRNLAQTLASSSNKLLGLQDSAEVSKSQNTKSSRTIVDLKDKLSKSRQENIRLSKEIDNLSLVQKTSTDSRTSNDVQMLKEQNNSLRETIRAQNNVLVSADNATKTAEKLLLENARLKKQLDLAGKVGLSNGKSAKDLFARNEKLRTELKNRSDEYTTKIDGLKATLKQLRLENDRYVMGQVTSTSDKKKFAAMKAEIEEKEAFIKEGSSAITLLKMEVEKYKEEILATRNDQAKDIARKISDYKSRIESMEKSIDDRDNDLSLLKIENQDLKAQIKLSSDGASLRDASGAAIDKSKVKYVETSYPPVDEVSPLLEHDGGHKFDKEDFSNDESNSAFLSETLLSQELKPLPN
ncbi:MAG: hypothetical protein ACRBB3_00360 [Alphaproteobacteria bacterium]